MGDCKLYAYVRTRACVCTWREEVYMCMCILLLCRANMESETRVENKRIVRRMQQESVEHAMEEKLQMAEREREYKEKQKRQEEQLTKVRTYTYMREGGREGGREEDAMCTYVVAYPSEVFLDRKWSDSSGRSNVRSDSVSKFVRTAWSYVSWRPSCVQGT